jgi:hypothetical protein
MTDQTDTTAMTVNIDGEIFEDVEVRPSTRFEGWVRVRITHRSAEVTYHLPPGRIRWVQEGSGHGPLR